MKNQGLAIHKAMKSFLPYKRPEKCTLVYLIAEHARLTILNIFSTLLALIRSCSLKCFEHSVLPACLLGPACLVFQSNM